MQRSDYTFYWGRYDSSSGFSYQSSSTSSYPYLYRVVGETGHEIQDNTPQVGINGQWKPANMVGYSQEFGTWSLIGTNGSSWLPNGLNFDTNLGRIYGTPSTLTTNGTYWLNYTVQGLSLIHI